MCALMCSAARWILNGKRALDTPVSNTSEKDNSFVMGDFYALLRVLARC